MRILLASLVLIIGLAGPADAQDRRGMDAQTIVCAVSALASGQLTPANLMCFADLARSLAAPPPDRPPAGQAAPIAVPPQSIAESAELIIKCYHPSATFVAVDIVQYPWQQGIMWNAMQSARLRIFWRGAVLGTNYETSVGFVERGGNFRVIYEHTVPGTWPASNRCALRNWVAMGN
jgi:hypothetical protein